MGEITLHAHNTASITFPYSPIVGLDTGSLTTPVPVYLIEHPEGVVLVDTGLNHTFVKNPEEYGAPHLAGMVEGANIKDGQDTISQLASAGYEPDDVDYVVLTHLHFDHTGYIDEFPDAEFIIQQEELQYAWWPNEQQFPFFLVDDFQNLRRYNVNDINGNYDIFGDQSIVCIPTPGHTPGHQSVKVEYDSGETTILAADIAYCREAYEEELWMNYDWSVEETLESIRKIKQIAATERADVSILHDEQDLSKIQG